MRTPAANVGVEGWREEDVDDEGEILVEGLDAYSDLRGRMTQERLLIEKPKAVRARCLLWASYPFHSKDA